MSDSGPVHFDGDKVIYRASGLYTCVNALLMWRLGYEGEGAPGWMQERFAAGHDHEPLILNRLKALDYNLSNAQTTVELPIGENVIIRGHIDGLNTSDRFKISSFDGKAEPQGSGWFFPSTDGFACIVDAKALSQSSFEKWVKGGWDAFPYYLWQQAFYMYALDVNGVVMAVKNKNTDKLLCDYYSRSYIESKLPLGTIIQRVLEVEKLANGPGETALFEQPCDGMKWPCAFFRFHPESEDEDAPEVTDFDQAEMDRLVRLYREAREMEAKGKKDATDFGAEIAKLLKGQVATAKIPGFTISTYHHGSSVTDWDAIAEKLGEKVEDVQKLYTKVNVSSKLSTRVNPDKKKKES